MLVRLRSSREPSVLSKPRPFDSLSQKICRSEETLRRAYAALVADTRVRQNLVVGGRPAGPLLPMLKALREPIKPAA